MGTRPQHLAFDLTAWGEVNVATLPLGCLNMDAEFAELFGTHRGLRTKVALHEPAMVFVPDEDEQDDDTEEQEGASASLVGAQYLEVDLTGSGEASATTQAEANVPTSAWSAGVLSSLDMEDEFAELFGNTQLD